MQFSLFLPLAFFALATSAAPYIVTSYVVLSVATQSVRIYSGCHSTHKNSEYLYTRTGSVAKPTDFKNSTNSTSKYCVVSI
ncbi:hypothetical protein WAI453_001072 [Rhynchosporium graminicola]